MARPTTVRRAALDRTGHCNRSGHRSVPHDDGAAAAPGASSPRDDSVVPAASDQPIDQAAIAEMTPTAYWALLPAAERDRLGVRLSRLVLKAVRPPITTFTEDCQ